MGSIYGSVRSSVNQVLTFNDGDGGVDDDGGGGDDDDGGGDDVSIGGRWLVWLQTTSKNSLMMYI